MHRHTDRQTGKAGRQASRQAGRQTGRHAGRQTSRQAGMQRHFSQVILHYFVCGNNSSPNRLSHQDTIQYHRDAKDRQLSVLTSVLAALTQQCMQFSSQDHQKVGAPKQGLQCLWPQLRAVGLLPLDKSSAVECSLRFRTAVRQLQTDNLHCPFCTASSRCALK